MDCDIMVIFRDTMTERETLVAVNVLVTTCKINNQFKLV